MKAFYSIHFLICCSLLFLWSCSEDDELGLRLDVIEELQLEVNPSGVAPLTAIINLSTNTDVSVSLRVVGEHGSASDVIKDFTEIGSNLEIPVLGLYAERENRVELTLRDRSGNQLGAQIVTIQTEALIPEMPDIDIDVPATVGSKAGFNLVNYFGLVDEGFPQRAFMFDAFGDIRWFLDYTDHPVLSNLFYDNGLNRLQNGNMIMGDGSTGALYEIDMFGEIANTFDLQGFGFHHHVIEKPDGNFLVTVNDQSKPTEEDVILEIDRNSGSIVNTWDLNNTLDNGRRVWETDRADLNFDWFHANAIEYSQQDDAIIVSGRTQGTVKLTADNEVIWILAPHRSWETSGNGIELSQFLLQPLDAQGNPITDQAVLDGEINHPDFEWAWYQHSPILLPNGHVMLFDNGENRNYAGPSTYSRAVEYRIDEENMTIQQVWSYGKERGGATYSEIVSKVSYDEEVDNVLFTPGAITFNGATYGKVVEVDRQQGQVHFEATITPPNAFFGITFHNVQRMPMYPD